jgi:hypothetical protein
MADRKTLLPRHNLRVVEQAEEIWQLAALTAGKIP